MKRAEFIFRILIITGLLFVIGVPLFLWRQTPLIHVSMAENGGWNPDTLKADVGKPLHLRLTSDDVVHGFAIGQMDMQSVDVLPGKVTDLTLTLERPGTYTFYCTRWCGINHWRMRGTIEVSGSNPSTYPASVPLYVVLKLDIDATHETPLIPLNMPSAVKGRQLVPNLDLAKLQTADFYQTHSPFQAFQDLNSTQLNEIEKWDVVAYLWQTNTTPESLASGQRLFAQNCAACHGENGGGNGVFAADLKASGEASKDAMTGSEEMKMQIPANFTDSKRILGASPALLQGKILRGGMGTGMPMWGSIFTEKQIWDLVSYIYSFQFGYQE